MNFFLFAIFLSVTVLSLAELNFDYPGSMTSVSWQTYGNRKLNNTYTRKTGEFVKLDWQCNQYVYRYILETWSGAKQPYNSENGVKRCTRLMCKSIDEPFGPYVSNRVCRIPPCTSADSIVNVDCSEFEMVGGVNLDKVCMNE